MLPASMEIQRDQNHNRIFVPLETPTRILESLRAYSKYGGVDKFEWRDDEPWVSFDYTEDNLRKTLRMMI